MKPFHSPSRTKSRPAAPSTGSCAPFEGEPPHTDGAQKAQAQLQTGWQSKADGVSLLRPACKPKPVWLQARPQKLEIDLHASALVVVDMQNDFCHPQGWFGQKGVSMRATRKPIPMLQKLLPLWRAAGGRVVWLNWGVRPDRLNLPASVLFKAKVDAQGQLTGVGYAETSPVDRGPSLVPGHWGAQVVDELPVAATDITVFKHRLSGFHDNELDSLLRQQGISTLLFAGINTDRCVFSSLQDAGFLGYDCVLLEDVCATPSPAYVSRAILFLVEKLHGFVASAQALTVSLTPKGARS
jgi:ureidoacrylate peracid hydrolase